jgi:PAS domain S-box-containing protein
MDKEAVHILLVEDEAAHAELVRRAFWDVSHAGRVRLTVASNLAEAQACLAQGSPPDLVIADLVLPDGRGTSLLPTEDEATLLNTAHRLPVVIMTSHGDEHIAVEAMKAGALDYVVKSAETLANMPRVAERALREWGHIIERTRAEEALRESEEKYRLLTETADDIIFVNDVDGQFLFVNKAGQEISGYTEEELLGMKVTDLITSEYVAAMVKRRAGRTAGDQRVYLYQAEFVNKTGQRIPVEVSSSPLIKNDELAGILVAARDITARKRVEEQLRFQAQLLDSVRESVVATDLEGHVIYWGKGAETLYGYRAEEVVGKLVTFIVEPEDEQKEKERMRQVLEQGLWSGQYVHRRKDGSSFWADTVISLVTGKNGQPAGMIGIDRDITERKRLEDETLARWHEAETLRRASAAVAETRSLQETLTRILEQLERVVPYDSASVQLLGGGHMEIVSGRGFPDPEAVIGLKFPVPADNPNTLVVESRKPVILVNAPTAHSAFQEAPHDHIRAWLGVPLIVHNQLIGMLAVDSVEPESFSQDHVRLVTPFANQAAIAIQNAQLVEGLEAEVAARTAEIVAEKERSETILRSIDDVIVMTDPKMRIQYVNDAFTTVTGYTAAEALEQSMLDLMGGTLSEHTEQSIRLAQARGVVWQGEVTYWRKDGRSYDAALTIVPVRDAKGDLVGYVASHRDISQLKELDRARTRFIANVSHQLRTPVANMKVFASLLRTGRRPEKTERYVAVLEEQVDRLGRLIDDILEMTTLDSGQAITAWEPVSLFSVVGDTMTRYQSQAEASGVNLGAVPAPPDLPTVKGDPVRLTQALAELVENGIIFTPSGGHVTIEAGTAQAGGQDWVTIAVHDTGPGISSEEQKRVFDRFYRGSLSESGNIPGTGLGLSLVKEILRAHGGRVTVESPAAPLTTDEECRGSTFTLWLRPEPNHIDAEHRRPG